ncbi:MAG: oligosaccharide flippase family protein [Aquificales bacterium]|nr:oligosaccharide flippase family protein [Aquificales bacterium]
MSLAKRSIESSFYNVVSYGFQIAIIFIRSVALARILSPELFGVYVFVGAIVSLPRTLSRFGLGGAYVHHAPETNRPEALGVYLSFITISTFLVLVIPGCIIAFFLNDVQRLVLGVLIISSCLAHFVVPAQAKLTRLVLFRRPAFIELVTAVITTITAVSLAWYGFGIWSLLSIDILTAIILMIGFYLIKPVWKPRFAWSAQIIRYYWSYGGRIVQAELLGQLLARSDDLWVGHYLGDLALGFYSRAYTFANYPRRLLAQPISTVVIGTYAEVKDNRKQLSKVFFQVNSLIIRVGFLMAGALALIAPELIQFVLGEKWMPMVSAFQLMLFFTLLDPIKLTVGKMFVAIGHPKILVRVRIIQLIVLIVGLFMLGWRYGIEGVAVASTIMTVTGMLILLWKAHEFVDYSTLKLFAAPLIAFIIGFILVLSLTTFLNQDSIHYLIQGLIKLATFISIYGISMLIMEHKQIVELFRFVSVQFIKRK